MTDEEKVRRLLSAGMLDDADEFRRCFDGALRDARAKALEEAACELDEELSVTPTQPSRAKLREVAARIRALKGKS